MNSYKGFEYPTLREFYADEENYTYSENENKWSYILGGINVLIDKDKGAKEVDDIFKDFIDQHYEDIKKVRSAFNTAIADGNARGRENLDKIVNEKINKVSEKMNINIEELSAATRDDNTLNDEQLEKLAEAFEETKENSEELKTISELPSNNGVIERDPEDIEEKGEFKDLTIQADPNTGMQAILGDAQDLLEHESFEDMIERINTDELDFGSDEPLTEEEVSDYLSGEHPGVNSIIDDLVTSEYPLSKDAVKIVMQVANRRMQKENFNVYKELPNEVKQMIDKYTIEVTGMRVPMNSVQVKTMRNKVAESLIDDFINNIQMDRLTSDFGKEVQDLFSKGANDVSETIVGYSKDKLDSYRRSLDKVEDPEKRERLSNIIQMIDDAYALTSLKEYAKTCKIKKFDLEKPSKYYNRFTAKYSNSAYDAFSLQLIMPILYRHFSEKYNEEYTEKDISAFFIAFCKQVTNYNSNDILQHSYMYFITYNIALMDVNVSENTKSVSDEFLENIREVIDNLRERNGGVL